MFELEDVMKYEPISDNMTWKEFKNTNLYKLYLRHSTMKEFKDIKTNVDNVMSGRIDDRMIKSYGFTRHDTHAPWKLYMYLRVALKRSLKK